MPSNGNTLNKMDDLNATPVIVEVIGHNPAMAVLRLILAAQQTAVRYDFLRHNILDVPLTQERTESGFVCLPIRLLCLIFSEEPRDFFGRANSARYLIAG